MDRWETLPWRKLQRNVFKVQKRIYQASQRDDVKTVRKFQRLLMNSWSAKLLAVRKVTQDNRGKGTAGVDGVKALTPPQRLKLAHTLRVGHKARPVRRVWIPKPETDEQRPLGIPTIHDRALQTLVKLALEPEWEARFESNSYGFRPGRSCHDAVEAIFNATAHLEKYVLDADITKCFDRINHDALLDKLNTGPKLRRQIKAWLKAGVLDNGELFPTERGTMQGGTISPLLANVALYGMEELLVRRFPTKLTGPMAAPEVQRFAIAYRQQRKDPPTLMLMPVVGVVTIPGLHRFWLGQAGIGLLYLCTLGLCYLVPSLTLSSTKNSLSVTTGKLRDIWPTT